MWNPPFTAQYNVFLKIKKWSFSKENYSLAFISVSSIFSEMEGTFWGKDKNNMTGQVETGHSVPYHAET